MYAASCAMFAASLLVLCATLFLTGRDQITRERERATYVAQHYAVLLSSSVNNACSMLHMLDALIVQGKGEIDDFESVSSDIIHFYPYIRTVVVAPDGIIRRVYPLDTKHPALGHDLLNSPDRQEEARLARDSGILTIAGPFPLLQKGIGIAGRLPVFLDKEKERFWGLVCVVMDLPKLLGASHISEMDVHGYAYSLCRELPDGERMTIAASEKPMNAKPLEYRIPLPNAVWVLSVAPHAGWLSREWIFIRAGLGFVICLLLGFLAGATCSLVQKKRELESLSRTDSLTQLPNRLWLHEYSTEAMLHARFHNRLLAVCFLDMNGFKGINDTLGHNAGDALLCGFAERMRKARHPREFLARLGGDEFVLLLECETAASVRKRIDELLDAFGTSFDIADKPILLSLSMGIALFPHDATCFHTLMGWRMPPCTGPRPCVCPTASS